MAYMAVTRTRSGTGVIKRHFDILKETFKALEVNCGLYFWGGVSGQGLDFVVNVKRAQDVSHGDNTR